MDRMGMRSTLIATNAPRPNLPARSMLCQALAQNAKKPYWHILDQRGLLHGLTDFAVDGISKKFAQQIYDWFYSGGQ